MFPAAIMMPNWVPPALATSWTRLLFVSAMYTSPAPLSATPPGAFSSAAVAAPPSPDSPLTPAALPATVEIVPEAAATFWTRLLPVSAIYRSPPVLSVIPAGDFSSAAVAAPPSPEDPELPDALPATVEIVPDALAISWIRLLPVSAMYKLPPADSTPCGEPKGADAAGPPFPLLVPSPSRVYRSPGTGLPVASDDAQLSVHPYPSGPGVPACVCCCAAPFEAVKSAGAAAVS